MIKRYAYALLAVIIAMTVANYFLGIAARENGASGAVANPIQFTDQLKTMLSIFIGFGVGAYILGKRALLPGLVLYGVSAYALLRIIQSIALPVSPDTTLVDIFLLNWLLFIGTFIACVAGIAFGRKFAGNRN